MRSDMLSFKCTYQSHVEHIEAPNREQCEDIFITMLAAKLNTIRLRDVRVEVVSSLSKAG